MSDEEYARPASEVVLGHLAQIVRSREFCDSPRMCRFLQFVVERSLAGEGASLKEYLIGVEVFDRKASYDPRVDPIVRVEARRLRAKLTEYYTHQSKPAGFRIDLPTGTYAPVFRSVGSAFSAAPSPPEPIREKRLAVLPFSNFSSDPESEYFSDGLTEELTHLLTRIPQLQVVSWNSAVLLKGEQMSAATAAEHLAADVLLRGSVRRSGDRIRIMAQLTEARTGLVLWSESYDRQFEDLFEVQDNIAFAIASAFQLRLMQPPRLRTSSPGALAAYNLYLKGRYHWNTRRPEALQTSVHCFQEAIALDPDNAIAHAGLADAYTILVDYSAVSPSCIHRAEQAALKATELDPLLAEPYATLAFIRSLFDWNWDEGEALYRRSIELNPSYASARHWYGADCLAMLGRFEEAAQELATARRLDPLSSIMKQSSGFLCMLWGRYDEAMDWYSESVRRELTPGWNLSSTGRLYIQMREYGRAIEALEAALARTPDTPGALGALRAGIRTRRETGQSQGDAGASGPAVTQPDGIRYLFWPGVCGPRRRRLCDGLAGASSRAKRSADCRHRRTSGL